jgi:hypothetical protein
MVGLGLEPLGQVFVTFSVREHSERLNGRAICSSERDEAYTWPGGEKRGLPGFVLSFMESLLSLTILYICSIEGFEGHYGRLLLSLHHRIS